MMASISKKEGMREYCEVPYNEICAILLYGATDEQTNSIDYWGFSNWERFKLENREQQWETFKIIEGCIKFNLLEKNRKGSITTQINYIESEKLIIKKHWKRDKILKRANIYEKEKWYDKAIKQYQKILTIFPDDEVTKEKIESLRGLKAK